MTYTAVHSSSKTTHQSVNMFIHIQLFDSKGTQSSSLRHCSVIQKGTKSQYRFVFQTRKSKIQNFIFDRFREFLALSHLSPDARNYKKRKDIICFGPLRTDPPTHVTRTYTSTHRHKRTKMKSVQKWVDKIPKRKGHTRSVWDMCFSPDGSHVVVAVSNRVVVYDAIDKEIVHSLRGHKGAVYAVAYAKDGKKYVHFVTEISPSKRTQIDRRRMRTSSSLARCAPHSSFKPLLPFITTHVSQRTHVTHYHVLPSHPQVCFRWRR